MLQPLAAIAAPSLATQGAPRGSVTSIDVVLWVGILIVADIVGGAIIMYLRRRLLAKDAGAHSGGLLLHDLRDMLKRGEISEEEFQAAKDAITARVSGKPLPPRPPRPVRDDALRAPPGFDLLGRPLPRPAGDGGAGPSTSPRSGERPGGPAERR
jgi:hypothetical protein